MGLVEDLAKGKVGVDFALPYGPAFWRSVMEYPSELYSKINTIVEFFEIDCGSKWIVYVQTLLPVLGNTAIALIDFDFDDIVRGAIRPMGRRSRAAVLSGISGRFKFEIPELGEEIGVRIPGAKLIKANKVWGKTRFLWIVDGVLQRLSFYWLLLDLAVDGFYNWALGIIKSGQCLRGYKAGAFRKVQAGIVVGHEHWRQIPFYHTDSPQVIEKENWGERVGWEPFEWGFDDADSFYVVVWGWDKFLYGEDAALRVVDPRSGFVHELIYPIPAGVDVITAFKVPAGQRRVVEVRNPIGGLFNFYYEREMFQYGVKI